MITAKKWNVFIVLLTDVLRLLDMHQNYGKGEQTPKKIIIEEIQRETVALQDAKVWKTIMRYQIIGNMHNQNNIMLRYIISEFKQ